MKLEAGILREMWPRAPQAKVSAIAEISEAVFAENGIDDWNVVVHLMANISAENGDGTIIRESGNYREERITEIFGPKNSSAKVTPDEAKVLAHNSQALFNRVYGPDPRSPKLTKELGNTQPGDGYKFRGGGDLQLTGRGNFMHMGNLTGHTEIIDDPDLLSDPKISFTVACAEFRAIGCIPIAKRGLDEATVVAVRKKVNGGKNGLSTVKTNVKKWAEALPEVESPSVVPRGADTRTDENKGLMSSRIMKGAVSTAVPLITAGGAKVAETANTETQTISVSDIADKVSQASDAMTTVSVAKDQAVAIVQTVKPFLGIAPGTWQIIAVCAIGVAIAAIGYTIWERYKKMRDQGV